MWTVNIILLIEILQNSYGMTISTDATSAFKKPLIS